MKRRRWSLVFATAAVAACTYKEYNTYNEVQAPDAGAPNSVAGAAGGGGQSGAAGASTSGTGGAIAGAGGIGSAGPGCRGCLRLTTSSNASRNLRLEFDDEQNLAQTQLVWRMRVPDFTGEVSLTFYAQSGNNADEQVFLASVNLAGGSTWQELGADFSVVQSFSPPQFVDAGGAAGGGFDPGFPFDKTEVERVGVIVQPNVPGGVFTPLTIEIDSVTFSNRTDLSTVFATNDVGFELVEADGASADGATLVHVGG